MATGFMARFNGRVAMRELWLTKGNLVDKASGIFATQVVAVRQTMPVTAVATTDFTAISIPAGATLLRATVYTTTGYGAATDALVSIGSSAGAQTYVAQTSVKAAGVVALTLVNAAAAALSVAPTAPQLYVRVTQTGAASATGAATLVLEYMP